ncbi:MAG: carbohydrate kinase family protein, partial [Acidobacteria bacterium]|nr:carbohydrate kinase family protein [Acidobacteriota bacterium]
DTSLVKVVEGKFCASFFCSTDQHNSQIASFYTGAMADAAELSFRGVLPPGSDALVIIAPNDPAAMVQYAHECSTMGLRYIWDPGQQCARMDAAQLAEGLTGAFMVICNDYEFELIRQKTGLSEADVLAQVPILVVTKGEQGSTIMFGGQRVDVPAVSPVHVADPTGVGDAYRGGFMKGLAAGADPVMCGCMGSVAATYALEFLGGTYHSYTPVEFAERYAAHFGPLPVAL